jgi:hypothetical protein
MDDWELLQAYARTGSEAFFQELVDRYAPLVYSSALRQLGVPELAEEVAQSVFCLLAQKAHRLSKDKRCSCASSSTRKCGKWAELWPSAKTPRKCA